MDRNIKRTGKIVKVSVALRKESVDRNHAVQIIIVKMHASLSARRAWIEISNPGSTELIFPVALRKESVDRNLKNNWNKILHLRSLSARRAWIEIVSM